MFSIDARIASTLVCVSAICSAAAAMLVLPQVAFALIGGLLFRKYRN